MQAHAFPRTSGAKNPTVIVKVFIFIFLRLKVVLQTKPCKGGRCNLEGWSRLLVGFHLCVRLSKEHKIRCRLSTGFCQGHA